MTRSKPASKRTPARPKNEPPKAEPVKPEPMEEDDETSESDVESNLDETPEPRRIVQVQPTSYFFGVTLTAKEPTYTWQTKAPADEDPEQESVVLKVLRLRQVAIGHEAKEGERNIVDLVSETKSGQPVSCTIANLTCGQSEMAQLGFDFQDCVPVKLKLSSGSGPVSITGVVKYKRVCGWYNGNWALENGDTSYTTEEDEEDDDEDYDESEDEDYERGNDEEEESDEEEEENNEKEEKSQPSKKVVAAKKAAVRRSRMRTLSEQHLNQQDGRKKTKLCKTRYEFQEGYAVRSEQHSIDVEKVRIILKENEYRK